MARLTGPLLSLTARKTIADTVTYLLSRGISVARQRVIPANPNTTAQQTARNLLKDTVAYLVADVSAESAIWKIIARESNRGETWLSRAVRASMESGWYAKLTDPETQEYNLVDPSTGTVPNPNPDGVFNLWKRNASGGWDWVKVGTAILGVVAFAHTAADNEQYRVTYETGVVGAGHGETA